MKPHLVMFDYDNTIADTSAPGSGGMNVEIAYRRSITDIFGVQGLFIFEKSGGLRNRTPSEVVHELLNAPIKTREQLVYSGQQFYLREIEVLKPLMKNGKGVRIDIWDKNREEPILIEVLIRQKLQYLLSELGRPLEKEQGVWPKLTHGFREFWYTLHKNKDEGYPFATAIVSSGHAEFIERTFAMWGLPLPDYLVTEDDVRGMTYPREQSRRFKPGQLQMALAHRA